MNGSGSPCNRVRKFPLGMPQEYTEHVLCSQVRLLVQEDVLQDAKVVFESSGTSVRVSAFLLSLISPVFHKMVCGAFRESVNRQLDLQDVDERAFVQLLGMACGQEGLEAMDAAEVLELGKLADRFQMSEVVSALGDVLLQHLTVEECAEALSRSIGSGLSRVEKGCRAMALSHFEQLSRTSGFLAMTEESLGCLLDDDNLVAECEERVFEALVEWMKAGEEGVRGEGLLRKIRFPLMDDEYLAIRISSALPESELSNHLVREASLIKHVGANKRGDVPVRHLSGKALVPRVGKGVQWEDYMEGGERRLTGHTNMVFCLAECMGRVCSGSGDGTIRVWSKATLEEEQVLSADDDLPVWSLAAWEGVLIGGHEDGRVTVWDLATGRCDRVLEGHTHIIYALVVVGSRLVSASGDATIQVWNMGTALTWPCERTLVGHADCVSCLAVWQSKLLSGSWDKTIRVWELAGGAAETLEGHTDIIHSLNVHRDRLYSASKDGTIRVWALGSWERLHTLEAYREESERCPSCLTMSGSRLVSGSVCRNDDEDVHCELKVWDLDSLQCVHTLEYPGVLDGPVWGLLGMPGEVWGGVGEDVVVWGRL